MITIDVKKTKKAIDPIGVLDSDLAKARGLKPGMLFSTAELKRISDEISRDYAPVFNKNKTIALNRIKLSVSELLEISQWVSRVYSPKPSQIKEILLLPLDPNHVYVYWSQPDRQPGIENKRKVERHLSLRLFSVQPHHDGGDETIRTLFETAIDGQGQNRKTIALPSIREDLSYVAVIGERHPDQPFVALIQSNSLHLTHHGLLQPSAHPIMPVLIGGLQSPAPSSSNRQLSASGQR